MHFVNHIILRYIAYIRKLVRPFYWSMGNILTLGCKVNPKPVPKIWPISESGIEPTSLMKIKLFYACPIKCSVFFFLQYATRS